MPTTGNRWRALRCGGFLLVAFPLVVVAYHGLPVPIPPHAAALRGSAVAVLLLLLTRAFLRAEGRDPRELGLSVSARAAMLASVGLAAGALLFAVAALVLHRAVPFSWELNPASAGAAVSAALLYHLATNTCEELAWRGYALDGLARALGLLPALLVIALVSAYFHVLSGWSWRVALVSTTAGSLLFSLVFLRWRSVPAAIGVHAGWNWMRDLILTPGGPASLWKAEGMERWAQPEWAIAEAATVGVILVACAVLLVSMRDSRRCVQVPPNT